MKVILNKDLSTLGEEGDVKDVAKGYARNYLFPRGIAFPYNESTVRLFDSRKGEIEARKAEKRDAAKGLKERVEALELLISMPAGANGRLFGSVTSQTVADELVRQGFQIERKRIELPGSSFKSVGKYRVTIHLYENTVAELGITVQGQVEKAPESPARGGRRRRSGEAAAELSAGASAPAAAEVPAVAEAPAGTEVPAGTEAPVSTESPAEARSPAGEEAPMRAEAATETDAPPGTEAPAEAEAPAGEAGSPRD
jgi:large subunit ribosomal protein L9